MLRHARNRVVSAMGALVLAAGLGVSTASSAVAAAVPLSVTTSPVAGGYSMSPAGNVLATFNLNVTGVDTTSFTLAVAATGALVPAAPLGWRSSIRP